MRRPSPISILTLVGQQQPMNPYVKTLRALELPSTSLTRPSLADGVLSGIRFSLTIRGLIRGGIPGLIRFSDRCLVRLNSGSTELTTEDFLTEAGVLDGTIRFGEDLLFTALPLEGHL